MARPQPIDPRWEYDITAYIGKRLAITFEVLDEDDEVVALTGYTASGKVTDEDGTTILTITPTISEALGQIHIDQTLSASLTAGRLDWVLQIVESTGEEHVRFFGKFNLKTY